MLSCPHIHRSIADKIVTLETLLDLCEKSTVMIMETLTILKSLACSTALC